MPAIEAHGLGKIYRTYKKEPGLRGAVKGLFVRKYEELAAASDVSFSIEEGEFVGFLGPNGAGKTTVLKMLAGLLHPTTGTASVLGFTPWLRQDALKRQFALLLGNKNALWWDLPARESLELNRAIYGIEQTQYQRIVDELTALLDVRDKLNIMVRELSLGERMKMELIAALLHQPRVLFLDEPTIGLDVMSQRKVREFLRHYNLEQKITIVLTSHYMQDIEELCPRVLVIDHGKLFFDGPLDDIVERFASYKILSLTFSDNQPHDLSAYGTVLDTQPGMARLRIEKNKIAGVTRELLGRLPLSDFGVAEVPIEDILSEVFTTQQQATARQSS